MCWETTALPNFKQNGSVLQNVVYVVPTDKSFLCSAFNNSTFTVISISVIKQNWFLRGSKQPTYTDSEHACIQWSKFLFASIIKIVRVQRKGKRAVTTIPPKRFAHPYHFPLERANKKWFFSISFYPTALK